MTLQFVQPKCLKPIKTLICDVLFSKNIEIIYLS